MTQDAPIVRHAARVILLDPAERVLLFRVNGNEWGRSFWITPGGGIRPGETDLEALHREIWEETGITGAEVGPCVWVRRHLFSWNGRWIEQNESYFVARVPPGPVVLDNQEEYERTFLVEHRWWSLDEIAAAVDERFVPRDFAALARPLVEGTLPPEPITVGR
jgi:8-oxo-dGTP pyrophosphatase MutT (NUDIX family)